MFNSVDLLLRTKSWAVSLIVSIFLVKNCVSNSNSSDLHIVVDVTSDIVAESSGHWQENCHTFLKLCDSCCRRTLEPAIGDIVSITT